MLKNSKLLGILLSIFMVLAFTVSGFAYYKYTQESGANFYVGTGDKADAQEDTNEMRQILDDLGDLLGHSKRDDLYPKDGTTGGTLSVFTNIVYCNDYDHPDDAITAIASANKTLLVTEAETCDTNLTVPANVTVKFERGGKWTINGEYFGDTTFTGTGLNDATIGGTYTGTADLNYKIEIDGTGTPDTFRWSDDGGSTWDATLVAIDGTAQTLNNGVTVTFGATTGHTLANYWTVTAYHAITVTFNGQIDAGLWQIFAYVGTGTLAGTPDVNYVYPEWWGAVADGTTNDSAAIINAFALSTKVAFSNASYSMESGVTKQADNVKVNFGNAKIIANFSTDGVVFTFGTSGDTSTETGLIIEGGYFELKTPTNTDNIVYLKIRGTKKFSIKDIHFKNVSNGGILIEAGCEDGVINGITVDGKSGYGTCRGIWLNGGTASDYASQLIDISPITRNATALPIYAVKDIKITNCTISDVTYSIYLMNTRDVHIEDNCLDISGHGGRCIGVNNYSPRTIIKGNVLIGDQSSTGILVTQFSHDVLIDGNLFEGTFGGNCDIYLAYLANTLITNNRFNTDSTQQILIDMGAKGIIKNNTFTRSTYTANHRAVKITTIDESVAGTSTYGDTATTLTGSIIENNTISVRVVPVLVKPNTSNAGRIPGLEAVIVRNNVFYDFDTAAASDEYGMRISGSTGTTYKIKYVYINNRMYPESDNDHNKVSIAGASTINVTGHIYYSATPPTVNDDIDLGYLVGSRWIDTTADKEYVCVNNANGAAVWKGTTIDYTINPWTPTITFGGNSVDMTYSIQAGLYIKVGKMITITGYITLSNKGTSTGIAKVANLPFTSKNDDGALSAASLKFNKITFANIFQGLVFKNTNDILLREITEAGVETDLDNTNFANDSSIIFSATYFTD